MAFVDHFSDRPGEYAAQRPTYPYALFAFIAEQSPSTQSAWDCGTGNGQAAVGLAKHFSRVEATDASEAQVSHAMPSPRVRYSTQRAEETNFADASFDAVCVAQALHWFDFERFFTEVARVLKPGGFFAAWGYDRMNISPTFDAAFKREVLDPMATSWPSQNRVLWDGYREAGMPFAPVEAPPFHIEVHWTLAQLLGYVRTWSGAKRLLAERADFLEGAQDALARAWPGSGTTRVTMPLHLLCGRHAG